MKWKKATNKFFLQEFDALTQDQKLDLFTQLRAAYPWEYRVAAMGPAEQNFYKATSKRSENA